MKPKAKAMFYNFSGFVVLFILIWILLGYLWPIHAIFLAVISAILANFLAPKFGAIKTEQGISLYMKWIFIKGIREF